MLTAFVPGKEAGRYEFTSALSVSVLRLLAPAINARIAGQPLPDIAPPPAALAQAGVSPHQGG